jgi:general secretion pathway protein I
MKNRPCKSSGFTLLEVLLAMAVFAIAGVSLLGAAGNNFTHISNLETKMLASWIASNQLVATSIDTTWPPKNNKKGQVTMAGREWYWQQKVIKTTDKDMRAILMEVRLTEGDKQAVTSLITYLSKVEK